MNPEANLSQLGCIEVHNLSKYYGDFCALSNLTFQVKSGEVVGLLGPNGAGKTTCLRILSSSLLHSSGTCTLNGLDVLRYPHQVKKILGYLPETLTLYPELSVAQYLSFVGRMRGLTNSDFLTAWEKLEVDYGLGLQSYKNRPIAHLSLGYRKRVGIAQALLGSPKILLLDEPTAGLDPLQIVGMRKLIRKLAGCYTVLISSHILTEISKTCDKVLILHRGMLAGELQKEDYFLESEPSLEEQFIHITREAEGKAFYA